MVNRVVHRYVAPANWIATAIIAIALCLIAHSLPLHLMMDELRAWLGQWGYWSPAAFCVLYLSMATMLMPVWPLTMIAASLYGLLRGTAVVSVAATATAGCNFLIARYVARDAIARRLERYPLVSALDEAISMGGWRIIALLRMSPVLPFGLQNYFYGLTAVRFWPYLIASALAMLPLEFLYVYMFTVGGEGLQELSSASMHIRWQFWLWRLLGLAATLAATGYLMLLARRAIRQKLAELQQEPVGKDEAIELEQSDEPEWPWSTLALVALAGCLLAVSLWAHYEQEFLQHWFAEEE